MATAYKNIGVVCDDYKLQHFQKALDEKHYEYDVKPGVTHDTRLIRVKVSEETFKHHTDMIGRIVRRVESSKPWRI